MRWDMAQWTEQERAPHGGGGAYAEGAVHGDGAAYGVGAARPVRPSDAGQGADRDADRGQGADPEAGPGGRHHADEPEETFATLTLLDIPDHTPFAHAVTCGHPPPLLLRDGRVRPLGATLPALPIGLGALAAHAGPTGYRVDTFPFEDGDLLLLYTDGVTEARDASGLFYPLAERVAAWTGEAPHRLLRRLHADLLAHAGGRLGDDAAAIAIRRGPRPTGP
jgi:hypothetical protein